MKDKVTPKIVRQLYFAFIYSRINYGIQVYGSCADTLLNKIQTIQNKLLKFFLNLDILHSTNTLHANLEILKVKDIYEVNIIAFVKKCISKECPKIFHNYYVPNQRHQAWNPKLIVPSSRIDMYEVSTKIQGAILWNKLNKTLKDKVHLKCFKKILTKYYVNRYT